MSVNDAGLMKSLDDQIIQEVLDFVYLGSNVQSSEKDMQAYGNQIFLTI